MSESNTQQSRSEFPKAQSQKRASRSVTRAAARRESSQAQQCTLMLARCHEEVGDKERAFYRSTESDAAAQRTGGRYSGAMVVGEWITVSSALVQSVLAGRVAGYGPVRFRYAAELAHELAAPTASSVETPTGASAEAVVPDVATLKRAVVRGLRNLGFEAVAGASPRGSAGQVSQSLEQLAQAVKDAQSKVPARVLEDAGLTAKVVDELLKAAGAVMVAHTSTTESRAQEHAVGQRENVLVGRLAKEVRLLIASARDARKSDKAIPKVRSRLVPRAKKKTAAKTKNTPIAAPVQTTTAVAAVPAAEANAHP